MAAPKTLMRRQAAVASQGNGFCGARAKNSGKPCRRRAGHGTDHPGVGRCRYHGGAVPITSGRYSSIQRPRIQELYQQFAADPRLTDISDEIAFVRALLVDFCERYEENRELILAWYEAWTVNKRPLAPEKIAALERVADDLEDLLGATRTEPTEEQQEALKVARDFIADLRAPDRSQPRQLLDISSAYKMASEVTVMVERLEKIRSADAVSRGDLLRILTEMGRIADLYITDEATRDKIRDGWANIVGV